MPENWVKILIKLGYDSPEKLKKIKKPGKLHQEMMEFREKNKLEIDTVTPDEVKAWLDKIM